ncbi:MAG: efflux RND transporter periplasmic adaptor subunit [Bryobacteraceae bacterium]|nr:efflux RND transporter periplasmic adaptor subunit [Bryobacteraceae bacterium]
MRVRWAVVCCVLLAACGAKKEPAAVQAEARPAAAEELRVVSLSPEAQKDAGVAFESLVRRAIPETLEATGRLTPDENRVWRVGAVTEGRIVRVLAKVGDAVETGQVLARMHSHDIHESRALYRKAVGEVARLRSAVTYAQRARDRARRLHELKAGSLEQAELAETQWRNAQTELESAEVEVRRTRQHLEEFLGIPADHVDEHHPGAFDHDDDLIPVKAPAPGVLLTRNVTPGTVVTPASDLFVLADLSSLWAVLSVSEEHLVKLRAGLPAALRVQAYDVPFRGKIVRIGEELDPTTRTISVRVQLENRGLRLKPEMYATAEIELGATEAALFLPQSATQEVNGQLVAFVRRGASEFEVRPVELGRTAGGRRQVLGGLKDGETVVTHGSFILKSQLLKASLAEE